MEKYLGKQTPDAIQAVGKLDILKRKKLAFFCSIKCPGDLILKAYDLARYLRDAGVTVAGGFHSPMEKECLRLLLRGKQPIIICLAKRWIAARPPKEWRGPLEEGRLLLLSPFGKPVKRVTSETAFYRNRFVTALADQAFVAYAAPGGKTEAFCRIVADWMKPLFSFDNTENSCLFVLGASPDLRFDIAGGAK